MLYRFVLSLSLPLLLLACNFDTSTAGPIGDPTNSDTNFGDCVGFESQPCEDCGATVCINGLAGSQILCQPDPNTPICGTGSACNNQGICETQVACSNGFSRKCGECGTESCVDWAWTECMPNVDACDAPTVCLVGAGQQPTCQAACSTDGYQTPYFDDSGINNGGDAGVFGGLSIPDIVPLGSQWNSMDGCDQQNGVYRECTCTISYYPGTPEVHCDDFCRY